MINLEKINQITRLTTGKIIKLAKSLINFYKIARKTLRSKTFRSISIALLIIIFFAYTTPLFLNNSGLKLQIEQKISEITNGSFVIDGPLEISLLPYPSISAKNVIAQNINIINKEYRLYAEEIKSKIPLFGISKNNISNKVTIKNAIIESIESKHSFRNDDESLFFQKTKSYRKSLGKEPKSIGKGISSKLFSFSNINSSASIFRSIPKINIAGSKYHKFDHLGQKKEFSQIIGEIAQDPDSVEFNLSFNSNKMATRINGKLNENPKKAEKSYIEILSPILAARIDGQFTQKSSNIVQNNFNGSIIANITDLKSFYGSYFSDYNLIYKKLNHNLRPIKFSANISSKDQEIKVGDIIFNSDLINGSGEANMNLKQKRLIFDFIFNINNLNLDLMWSGESISLEKFQNLLLSSSANTDKAISDDKKEQNDNNIQVDKIDRKIDMTAEINISNLTYLDGEIKDVSIYLNAEDKNNIMIMPLLFKTPDGGLFRVSGTFNNDNIIPKFIGKFDAKGKNMKDIFQWLGIKSQNLKVNEFNNYLLHSDILLKPGMSNFSNIYLNLNNNESEFLGNVLISKNSKDEHDVKTDINITNFDADKYFLTSGQNIYLSPGSFLKKILWLNNISYNNDVNLKFDNLIYNSENFSNQKIGFNLGRGFFKVYDFDVKSEKNSLRANLSIDIAQAVPVFKIRVLADKFYYNSKKSSNLSNSDAQKKQNSDFADQLFALPSLRGFNGIFNLTLKDVTIDDLNFKNTKIYSELSNGTMRDAKITSQIFDGSVEFNGFIQAGIVKSINGNLEGKNINIEDLIKRATNYNNLSGKVNINAGISSSAVNKDDFIKKLSSKIVFNAKPIELEGYGLNELVKKMFIATINNKSIKEPEAILFNKNRVTKFDQATGTIQISNHNDARFKASIKAPAINSVLSGSFSIKDKTARALFNSLFLTGNKEKQIPINIASSLIYKDEKFKHLTNLDQVRQYLGLPTKYAYDPNADKDDDNKQIDFTKDFEELKDED